MTEEKKIKTSTIVVEQLPQQAVNRGVDENGDEIDFITIPEALTKIVNLLEELKKRT